MANEQNLIPAKKGEIRNPKGRGKGTINFAYRVKKLTGDLNLAEKLLEKKPGWWEDLEDKDMANVIICAMLIQAASGNVKAADFIRKSGWGDKVTFDGIIRERPILGGTSVYRDDSDEEDQESEEEDQDYPGGDVSVEDGVDSPDSDRQSPGDTESND